MRRLDADSRPCELSPEDVEEILRVHIPYRLQHLMDAVPRIPARCMPDNQAFEAGAVAGRSLLSLLGITYSAKNDSLIPDTSYRKTRSVLTDDIKAPDLRGSFVDIDSLAEEEKVLLARFIRGVHKSSAHFTWKSEHQLDVETYKQAARIILRLLKEHLP